MKKTTITSIWKICSIFGLSLILLSINVPGSGGEEQVFEDQKSNDWINVSATADRGIVHFEWESSVPEVSVQITGPHDVNVMGDSDGDVWESVQSGNAQGAYEFRAVREINSESNNDGKSSGPIFQEYITSLRLGSEPQPINFFTPQSAEASGQAAKTYLRYQTFIPDTFLGAPDYGCALGSADYIFAGNGRSFDPASSSFKTRFQVTVDWTSNGLVTYSRTVGPTKRYEMASNGSPIMSTEVTATASNEDMILNLISTSSTLSHYQLDHSVTNPLCNALITYPIWYNTDVWIARSGAYTISNEYRRAPNHELYIKDSDQLNWKPLLQSPTYSMDCFNKVSPTQFFCSGMFNTTPGSTR